jgi:hypothetical protein
VNDTMRYRFGAAVVAAAIGIAGVTPASAQSPAGDPGDNDDLRAITARVHGTFQDASGGLGVVSGDMTIARFEVVNGSVVAIGRIAGAMADSGGEVLGKVDEELALAVSNVASTCNQLRMDLAATEAQILGMPVHFDKEVAGFDSREGATPKARPVLCSVAHILRRNAAADAVMLSLNDVVDALAAAKP